MRNCRAMTQKLKKKKSNRPGFGWKKYEQNGMEGRKSEKPVMISAIDVGGLMVIPGVRLCTRMRKVTF